MRYTQTVDSRTRSPIAELLYLAAPTVAQSVSYTAMQFIDTWMLSRLGTLEPTAAGNAGMFAFSIICFGFGVLLVVNTLVSQSFGAGEFHRCGQFFWQGMWVAIAYGLLVLPMIFVAPHLFSSLHHSPHLAEMESAYLKIVLLTTTFKMISTAAGQFLLGTNRPTMVFISAICGVGVNASLAFGIVLGHFGLPKLGIVGAAWAQNAGVFTECIVLLIIVLTNQTARFNVRDWRPRAAQLFTLIKIGSGAGLQIVADLLAWTLFLVWVMAKLGDTAMAANQFMFRYMVVSFMPAVGISQAVTALVGRYIGSGDFDLAARRAHLGFIVALVYMLTCGVLMIGFRTQLIHVFTHDPQVVASGATLLIFAGFYQICDAMYVVYNGALRGAGDTLVPGVVTIFLCWGLNVFGGNFVATHYPRWGVAGPWSICMLYGIILGIFIAHRFAAGGWRKLHVAAAVDSNAPTIADKLVVN